MSRLFIVYSNPHGRPAYFPDSPTLPVFVIFCNLTSVHLLVMKVFGGHVSSQPGLMALQTHTPPSASMRRRGVSFMELLAMEMKAEGKYVARGLSFR